MSQTTFRTLRGMNRNAKKMRTRPRGAWCDDRTGFSILGGRRKVRCPTCGRRLLLAVVPEMASFDTDRVGRRIPADPTPIGYALPPHKTSTVK